MGGVDEDFDQDRFATCDSCGAEFEGRDVAEQLEEHRLDAHPAEEIRRSAERLLKGEEVEQK